MKDDWLETTPCSSFRRISWFIRNERRLPRYTINHNNLQHRIQPLTTLGNQTGCDAHASCKGLHSTRCTQGVARVRASRRKGLHCARFTRRIATMFTPYAHAASLRCTRRIATMHTPHHKGLRCVRCLRCIATLHCTPVYLYECIDNVEVARSRVHVSGKHRSGSMQKGKHGPRSEQ